MGGFVDPQPPKPTEPNVDAQPPESKVVLTLPKPPSWRASSYDLLTGASVTEVDDTIPGELFDELFGDHGDQR